jgi:hypothetical protein
MVLRHIEELRKLGVKPPDTVPSFYRLSPDLLTTADSVVVKGKRTSGEVECVALLSKGRTYITVGSDHTDREEEKADIARSKELCPKIISKEVWGYRDIRDHWESIMLRSWVEERGNLIPYQEGPLSSLMPFEDIMAASELASDCSAIMLGTIPLKTEGTLYSTVFSMEIEDPVLKRRIRKLYRIGPMV